MQEADNNKKVIEPYLDNAEIVEIPLLPKNKIDAFLKRIGVRKRKLTYRLRKVKVMNRERMALKGFDLPKNINDGTYLLQKVFELSVKHTDTIVYCAAVALQNDENEPNEELIRALKMTDDEFLFKILDKSIALIDIQNFLNSIVLLAGVESMTAKAIQ